MLRTLFKLGDVRIRLSENGMYRIRLRYRDFKRFAVPAVKMLVICSCLMIHDDDDEAGTGNT